MTSKQEEMMGVSRSGRVRKKSSKLIDFESPEEAEVRPKKTATPRVPKSKLLNKPSPVVPPLQIKIPKKVQIQQRFEEEFSNNDSDEFGMGAIKDEFYDDDDEEEEVYNHQPSYMSMSKNTSIQVKSTFKRPVASESESDGSKGHSGDDHSDSEGEFLDVAGSSADMQVASQKKPSLYLLENAKKKLVLKDGKVVSARQKTQRKDKGKPRLTAFMVWAKDMRPSVTKQNSHLDVSGVTKRLGELWATTSQAERLIWKRKAMRLSSKAPGGMISTGVKPDPKPKPEPKVKVEALNRIVKKPISPKRSPVRAPPRRSNSPVKQQQRQRLLSPDGYDDFSSSSELYNNSATLPTQPAARAGEMEPLDVASHLHLLGESLTVIGSRLKEHEGQIAVSGSLSVLLDSALCALGPLLCLTRLTPETDGCPPETLTRILDNIAYIMPGL